MKYTDEDKTLALAAVFQSAWLVQELARKGKTDGAVFATSINSILVTDSASVAAVYGGIEGVMTGLQLVRDKMRDQSDAGDFELARYVLSMVQLAAQVSRHAGTLDRLGKGIEQVRSQASYFQKSSGSNEIHENVVAALAELYKDTISALSPRIVVNGEQGYLTIDSVVDKIRAALLAGIRGAVLWHQVGGRRWQLLFQRRRYVAEARWIMEKFEKERTLH